LFIFLWIFEGFDGDFYFAVFKKGEAYFFFVFERNKGVIKQ